MILKLEFPSRGVSREISINPILPFTFMEQVGQRGRFWYIKGIVKIISLALKRLFVCSSFVFFLIKIIHKMMLISNDRLDKLRRLYYTRDEAKLLNRNIEKLWKIKEKMSKITLKIISNIHNKARLSNHVFKLNIFG